ncbi:MAG TPA: gamma-glutamylcyclotransferase [Solirubrobacteraceae bacterium]
MRRAAGVEFVFGYGSLVPGAGGEVRRLAGVRRVLGVAMDNALDVPGYKRFVDAADGSRPAVFVAFADLVPAPAGAPPVNGVLVPVAADGLAALDARERNYDRIDVTGRIEAPPGRVWAYTGSRAGRQRFARGAAAGTVVVARAYVEAVQAGFRALGAAEHRAFLASTDFGGVPVWALERVDLPPA